MARRHVLAPYQRWLATDPHRFVSADKGRRIGGSFGVSLRAAMRGMGLRFADGRLTPGARPANQKLISASQLQANELLDETFRHVEALCANIPDRNLWPKGDPGKISFELNNGAKFRALPDNPRTARGGEGDVTLDEFAFSKDAKAIWDAVKAITDPQLGNPKGYQLTVVTTPLAEGSLAHQICRGDGSNRDIYRHFSRYHIDVYSAVRRGFPDPSWSPEARAAFIDRLRREAGSPDTFAQEYECSWLAANATFIPLELLHRARYEPEDLPSGVFTSTVYGGLDVGRKKHLTVLARVAKVGDTLWMLPLEPRDVMERAPFEHQEGRAADFLRKENGKRLAIDETGIGSAPCEAISRYAPGRVEAVWFTPQVKADLATSLKLRIETGRLRIPFDRDLIYDLHSLRKIVTSAGNIRYDSEDDSNGSHADRAWALALACHAAEAPNTVVRSTRVKI